VVRFQVFSLTRHGKSRSDDTGIRKLRVVTSVLENQKADLAQRSADCPVVLEVPLWKNVERSIFGKLKHELQIMVFHGRRWNPTLVRV
jgi:hypothetical protein